MGWSISDAKKKAQGWAKSGVNAALNLGAKVPGARDAGAAFAATVGAMTPATPVTQSFRDAAFTAAHNAKNPAVNVYGRQNPSQQPLQKPTFLAPMATGNVLGWEDGVPTGGVYGGGGGAGDYDPDLDPSRIAAAKQEVMGLKDLFERAFAEAMGKVDALALDRSNTLRANYGKQREGLRDNYAQSSRQIDDIYSSRGAFNSSYRDNEQGVAKKAFESAMGGIDTSEQEGLAEIGQFVGQQKAQFNAARPNYNVDDYTTVSDLLDVKAAVDEAVKTLGVTNAGLGTNSEFLSNLNKVAPVQETGSSALKAQLERLAGVNAPPEAKRAIAAQAINESGDGNDQQWMDYFERILAQQGSGAPVEVTA